MTEKTMLPDFDLDDAEQQVAPVEPKKNISNRIRYNVYTLPPFEDAMLALGTAVPCAILRTLMAQRVRPEDQDYSKWEYVGYSTYRPRKS